MDETCRITYIYGLIDPRDNRVRYVGKADCPRKRFRQHKKEGDINSAKANWLFDLRVLRLPPKLKILACIPHEGWTRTERNWIERYRVEYPDLTNDVTRTIRLFIFPKTIEDIFMGCRGPIWNMILREFPLWKVLK